MVRRVVVLSAAVTSMVSCYSFDTTGPNHFDCLPLPIPAIVITVRDSQGAPAARGATLTYHVAYAIPGSYGETGASGDASLNGLTLLAGVIPGTYDIQIAKAGYSDWVRKGIVVPMQSGSYCDPATQYVDALLTASPTSLVVVR